MFDMFVYFQEYILILWSVVYLKIYWIIACLLEVIWNIGTSPSPSTYKVKQKEKIRHRYNQVPHPTQDATLESDKDTTKHHKQEPRGQPFPSR